MVPDDSEIHIFHPRADDELHVSVLSLGTMMGCIESAAFLLLI